MDKLLPCPFCGGKALIKRTPDYGSERPRLFVTCCVCGVETPRIGRNKKEVLAAWNRRAQPENKPLTRENLHSMNNQRVWVQFRGFGMYGLVAYHADPDGDDGDEVYITNNLGGRSTFEEVLAQGGTVYRSKPEDESKWQWRGPQKSEKEDSDA
ncbi:MAG: Lar family restriction alleviation protein [Enterococcus lemanii]|jgi:Lar family restriction alleviation protein